MLFPIKYAKILYFLKRKWNSEIFNLIFSLSLFSIKLLLSFNSLGRFNWIFFFSIFLQVYVLIFLKKVKKKMKKNYPIVYAMNALSYFSVLYLSLDDSMDFAFFYGVEAMIIIYFNLPKIPNRLLRLILFGLFAFFFLNKITNLEATIAEILYFIYFIFVFEISLQFPFKKKKNKSNEHKKIDLNLKEKQEKRKGSISIFTQIDANIKKDASKTIKEIIPIKLINFIKIGVILINQDFDIVFTNDILLELFDTEDLEQAKIKFFDLEENIEISRNETIQISDLGFQDHFKNTLLFPESIGSFKIDEISEAKKPHKIISEESFTQFKMIESLSSKDDLDSQFRKWKKKQLSNNLSNKFFDVDKKSSDPKSVHTFLEKLFENLKQEEEANKYISRSDSLKGKEKRKYSLYVNYKSGKEGRDFVIFLNFILMEQNFDSNSKHEVLITIRKLSDLEVRFMGESKFKHKMLGSFCHELRTPINGIINMLDLIQSQNEEIQPLNEKVDSTFDELLLNAAISSHMLLNEIDDFIDYFSHRNEILEPHMSPFDFKSFFHEIYRIFSYVAKKKGLDLFIDLDENIPLIIFNDQQRISQILYNLLNNSLRFTNSGYIKISAALKKNNSIRISVLDTGSGIKTEDLNSLGSLNANTNDIKRSTCGFGLFMCNLLCLLIEGDNSEKKRGLSVYSEYGTGTYFSFYLNLGDLSEKLGNIRKLSSSEFQVNVNKKIRKVYSSEDKLFSVSSKERIQTSSVLSDSESRKNIKKMEKNSLQRIREKNCLKLFLPGNDAIISNRSILFKEGKRGSSKSFVQADNLISLGTVLDSSVQLKIDNLNCNCKKILIVDDVAFNIEVCRKLLKKMNFDVDCAFNGLDAVEKVKNFLNAGLKSGSNKETVDKNQNLISDNIDRRFCKKCRSYKIILMDIDMPIMDGIEATREILEILAKAHLSVSIIGLSAFDQEQVKDRAIHAGMKEFLTKPITYKKMEEIVIKYN